MIRDEDDILAESLRTAAQWFDRILVLDGTTDPEYRRRTDEILAAVPEVVWHTRDADHFTERVTDGGRQVLLAEARRRYGVDNWIGVLHGDEFMDQDPRPMLTARHPSLDPSLRVRVAHTFLHIDDRERWEGGADATVRDRVRHQMWPGVPESRFFFDDGSRAYDPAHHSKVLPRSFRNGPLIDGYVITQYNERSPERLIRRARQRAGRDGRSATTPACCTIRRRCVTSLDRPDAPFVPEFAGDPEGRMSRAGGGHPSGAGGRHPAPPPCDRRPCARHSDRPRRWRRPR
ncbi:MAG: glycosyltransferase family 2 protein [Acidimicrobiales bacterium]